MQNKCCDVIFGAANQQNLKFVIKEKEGKSSNKLKSLMFHLFFWMSESQNSTAAKIPYDIMTKLIRVKLKH